MFQRPRYALGALVAKRVLVVVAHPDDECMFFGPTILRLCEQGADVHILCLSNGDYEDKCKVRRTELWAACHELGVQDENICVITDPRLRDDPNIHWPVRALAKLLHHHLEALDVDTLVTFDRVGVTSHPKHCDIFNAVAYMFVKELIPKRCTVYTLDSVNILRKYIGFLDLPLSFVLSSKRRNLPNKQPPLVGTLFDLDAVSTTNANERYFLRWTESRRVVRAMNCHHSQMVWFRYLYIAMSRYMVINTLRTISLADVERVEKEREERELDDEDDY